MGYCRYQYNPSELYQRTKPGTAPEVSCGARTFPAMDEPEVACVRTGFGSDGAVYEYRHTGRHMARPTDDPFCPAHGGSAEPPPPPVTTEQLDWAYQSYMALVEAWETQQGHHALPAAAAVDPGAPYPLPGTSPAAAAAPVSRDDVLAAAQQLVAAAGGEQR